ncbi:M17L2 protein, partial [Serilophus lunatus]|nr:M17L2 protein [Serilophus lunatus]
GRLLLVTNTLSCGGLLAAGDALQQHWHRRGRPESQYQLGRTATAHQRSRACPVLPLPFPRAPSHWLVPPSQTGVALGHFTANPTPLTVPAGMGTLEGQALEESWDELKEKFWEFYKADWCVWPAAQLLNFLFVPPHYRVLYVNVVTLGWDTYLSYLKHRVSA